MRPETIEAMREASQSLVNIDELNAAAGAAIARMLGAEAALVTAGSASGLVLQAAACIAGDDPAKIARLPDTTGMRREFVIQRAHRFSYDQSYRIPGGVLVEIGLGRRTQPHELESAIGDATAGVIHLVSPFTSPPGVLSFEEVCAIAHARGVPVLVDAASMVPPRDNLFRYLRGGADLVIYSGGKGIRGPQSTGTPRAWAIRHTSSKVRTPGGLVNGDTRWITPAVASVMAASSSCGAVRRPSPISTSAPPGMR